jgi:hypothetical protein
VLVAGVIVVRRSFLLGRTADEAIADEKRETLDLLAQHDLFYAAFALARNGAFHDYFMMRGAMLAGGLHRVRLTGGRGIDR